MHYLIAERGEKVEHYIDRHELGLFDIDRTLDIMNDVGFEAQYISDCLMRNRGLYIGEKTAVKFQSNVFSESSSMLKLK